MMRAVLMSLAVLCTLASALPQPLEPRTVCPAVRQNASFEDLTGIPGNEFNPIPVPYKDLFYQGFDFLSIIKTGVLPGIIPHSGTKYAGISVITELQGTPMLTVNYPGSTVKSFSLSSFYFGCSINGANGAAGVPAQCDISITGYRGNDNQVSNGAKQVCGKQFRYNPTTALGAQQMAFTGAIAGCTDIQFLIVQATLPGGMSALNVDLLSVYDDIIYTTKRC